MTDFQLKCGACLQLGRECLPECELKPFYPMAGTFKTVNDVFGGLNVSRMVRAIDNHQGRVGAVTIINHEAAEHVRNPNHRSLDWIQKEHIRFNQLNNEIINAEQRIPWISLMVQPHYQQLLQHREDAIQHQILLQQLDNLFLQRLLNTYVLRRQQVQWKFLQAVEQGIVPQQQPLANDQQHNRQRFDVQKKPKQQGQYQQGTNRQNQQSLEQQGGLSLVARYGHRTLDGHNSPHLRDTSLGFQRQFEAGSSSSVPSSGDCFSADQMTNSLGSYRKFEVGTPSSVLTSGDCSSADRMTVFHRRPEDESPSSGDFLNADKTEDKLGLPMPRSSVDQMRDFKRAFKKARSSSAASAGDHTTIQQPETTDGHQQQNSESETSNKKDHLI